jgi:glycosyltransferase involved in cell wall biosynthesis
VNDGSSDDTEVVANEWISKDNRFKYLEQGKNGPGSARNAGLKIAKGEFIQFLDADDFLEINKIYHQIRYINEIRAHIDIMVSGYRYFNNDDPLRELLLFGNANLLPEVFINKEDKRDLVKLFSRKNPFVISAPLYRKSVFERIGLFDEELMAFEDWDFHYRCASEGMIFQHTGYELSSKTLIRLHKSSAMANEKLLKKNLVKFFNKHMANVDFAKEHNLDKLWITGRAKSIKMRLFGLLKLFTPPVLVILIKKVMHYE